jgi:hypothetical protein
VITARPASTVERTWRWAKRNSSVASMLSAASRKNRPMAGIVTALILNGVAIVLMGTNLFKWMVSLRVGDKPDFYIFFPQLEPIGIFHLASAIVGGGIIVVGALMSQVCHPLGNQTVRVTAKVMLLVEFAITSYTAQFVIDSVHWHLLTPTSKTMLLIQIIGGGAGTMFKWWLFMFLFRKSKWP